MNWKEPKMLNKSQEFVEINQELLINSKITRRNLRKTLKKPKIIKYLKMIEINLQSNENNPKRFLEIQKLHKLFKNMP